MLEFLRHRGPDGEGTGVSGSIGIGMRRLAIIDVAGGQQPIYNEDETIAIVCNGEIYNHVQLRQELEQAGHRFRTHSDVETILHLYEETGEKCFSRLNGMFAVAIADFRSQKLVLARDPFGQKPLYVWQEGAFLRFASELKALARLPEFCKTLSTGALASFLQFRYVPWPLTIYEKTRKLAPGSYCIVDASGRTQHQRYFQVDFDPANLEGIRDPHGSLTRQKLVEAVDRHLMSERPLGVFLSGGLDSSAVVACMQVLGHKKIHTYTVGFEGFLENEFENAQKVARHFQTEHREVLLNADDFWNSLDEVVYYADEPLADLTTVPLYHLSKGASRELVVVLSGEGSDELLAGYPGTEHIRRLFERQRTLRPLARLGKKILPLPEALRDRVRRVAGSAADYLAEKRLNMTNLFDAAYRHANGNSSIRDLDVSGPLGQYYADRQSWDGVHLYLGALIEWWLPDDLLHKADRMTMAHSLELRCPFLDAEFARHCLRLKLDDKVKTQIAEPSRKIALKKGFQRDLPDGIALQKKKGFPIPVYEWLSTQFLDRARAEILRRNALGCSMFQPSALDALFAQAIGGDSRSQQRLWSIILLNKWGDRWL